MIFSVHLSRYVRVILLVFVLFLAVVLSAVRVLLPEISEYRAEIVSSISASIGKPIEMDSMAAGLNGIRPEVVLNGLKILDPIERKVLLRFDQLRAGLNVKEFLLTGNFQPRWVTIRGARLSVRRKLDGSLKVAGLDSGAEMPKWIFEDGQFELLDSEVDWLDLKYPGAGVHFSSTDIRLLNTQRRHKVAIDVDLPLDYGESLSIRMDFQGSLLLRDCCTGKIYVQARDIRYGKLLEAFAPDGYRVAQGRGAFRFWSTWEKSVLVNLAGEVDFQDGTLSHRVTGSDVSEGLIELRGASGGFRWVRQNQGWNLSVRRLVLNPAGDAWPLTEFGLSQTVDAGARTSQLYFTSSYLKLDDLRRFLVELRVVAPAQRQILLDMAPSGEIFDLKVTYSSPPGENLHWFVCGRFENIGFRPRQGYPGAKNLAGNVCGDRENGRFQLAATQAEIELPEVFRNPSGLTALEGDFHWHRDNVAWTFRGEGIKTVNPVLAAESRMFLRIPLAEGEPFLDWQAAFENVDATAVHRYLPVNVLKKPLIDWLDAAFLSGTVSHGGALFRGPVTAFPFRGGEGVFETLFYTKDVVLSYHPDWPVIHTEVAEVRFFQAGMSIRGEQASISGTRVEDVWVRSADFELDDYLTITGSAGGTLEQSIRFINSSPLGPLYKPLLEFVSMRGDNRVEIELKVPVAAAVDDVVVNGKLALKQARLDAFGMEMDRINGTLDFSRDRIQGKGIRGVLLDSPVRVKIADNDRGLAVQIRGSVALDSLAGRFPSGFWEFFDGASDYSMDLQIPKLSERLYADVDLRSDLSGIAIRLPEPMQKRAMLPRKFNLTMHLEPGRAVPLDLVYGAIGLAHLKFWKKKEGFALEQGMIRLGRVLGAEAAKNGLSIVAGLERFDLAPWNTFLASLKRNAIPDAAAVNRVDIRIAELMVGDLDLGPFTLKMYRNNGVWDGFTESSLASGQFTGKTNDQNAPGLNLTFEYLRIPEQDGLQEKNPKEKVHFDPGSIVDLKLRAEHFFWKKVDYGKLDIATSRQPHGMKIDSLNLRGNGLDLNLSGFWTASESTDRTFISGNLTIDDLGQFLTRLGKSDVIRDSNVRSNITLEWKDPLYDLNFETLSGNAQVEFGSGRLLTVEPGFGRLFGVFNLDGLKNLLLFDFGKLFGQGLAFEGVESAFLLTEGRATINRLTIDAVPAEIIVAGEIDLVREQFDDVVTVVPKGVVAAGASMLLTQELPGAAVDGLINRQYQVTGKWDNPEIVRLPGTGKPL
ncbi:MAG: YhdP family protein [Methylococcales bacterium]